MLLNLQSGGLTNIHPITMQINVTLQMREGFQGKVHSVVGTVEMGLDLIKGQGKSSQVQL